jgi:hypothetical protein
MLKSRCLMFSVPTDQVYLELDAVGGLLRNRIAVKGTDPRAAWYI